MKHALAFGMLCCLTFSCRRSDPSGATATASATAQSVVAPPTKPPPEPIPAWKGKILHLWVTSCDDESSEVKELAATIKAHPGLVDSVGLACNVVRRDGSITTTGERPKHGRPQVAALLQSLSVETTLVVANTGKSGFDGALGLALVKDSVARAALIKNLLTLQKAEKHAAIELDLEAMPTAARDPYSKLAHELRDAAGPNVRLEVDVHPKTADDPGWDGPGAHDYVALADAGAIVRLMTYDFSIGPVPPGPTTTSSWVKSVVAYARGKGVPAAQLEIGVPGYGYDFPPKGAKSAPVSLKHREVLALIKSQGALVIRDPNGTPYFPYDGKDGLHQVWYDDAESVARLLDDLATIVDDVRGASMWGIDGADPRMVEILVHAGF